MPKVYRRSESATVCRFFERGYCRKSFTCPFSHLQPRSNRRISCSKIDDYKNENGTKRYDSKSQSDSLQIKIEHSSNKNETRKISTGQKTQSKSPDCSNKKENQINCSEKKPESNSLNTSIDSSFNSEANSSINSEANSTINSGANSTINSEANSSIKVENLENRVPQVKNLTEENLALHESVSENNSNKDSLEKINFKIEKDITPSYNANISSNDICIVLSDSENGNQEDFDSEIKENNNSKKRRWSDDKSFDSKKLEKCMNELAEMKKINEQLESSYNGMKGQYILESNLREEYVKKCAAEEKKTSILYQKNQDYKKNLDTLKNEKAESLKALQMHKKIVEEQTVVIKKLESTKYELQSEVTDLNLEVTELKQNNSNEIEKFKKVNEVLANSIQNIQTKYDDLEKENAKQKVEFDTKLEQLESKQKSSSEIISELEKKQEELKLQYDKLKTTHLQLCIETQESNSDSEIKSNKLSKIGEEKNELEIKLEVQTRLNEKMELDFKLIKDESYSRYQALEKSYSDLRLEANAYKEEAAKAKKISKDLEYYTYKYDEMRKEDCEKMEMEYKNQISIIRGQNESFLKLITNTYEAAQNINTNTKPNVNHVE